MDACNCSFRQTSAEHRQDPRIASRHSLTIYLDNDYTGGEISFVTGVRLDGTYSGSVMSLRPLPGDAVLFYQGIPEFSHAVAAVKGIKSIMRSDVMYMFTSAEEADVGALNSKGGEVLLAEDVDAAAVPPMIAGVRRM
jgi:hypothetical protein